MFFILHELLLRTQCLTPLGAHIAMLKTSRANLPRAGRMTDYSIPISITQPQDHHSTSLKLWYIDFCCDSKDFNF